MPSALDLDAVRATLAAERARLRAELDEPIQGPGQMTYGSQAAAATQVFEQQRDLALRDREKAQLMQVEAAIAAIADGSYGTCRTCAKAIPAGRLEAIPWSTTCVDCARRPVR